MARTTRKIVHIDGDKCDGCGACVPNCAEGAIRVVDGKARLMAENLCDGLGACLGHCPKGAITISERPADEFDEEAVREAKSPAPELPCGCPGSMARDPRRPAGDPSKPGSPAAPSGPAESKLGNWPVQLRLLPEKGDLWRDADVLLAADCVAYALPDFHARLLGGKTLAVACPKLDDAQAYAEKLGRILAANPVRSITIARMEVPCCGGLERIVQLALGSSGKDIPVRTMVIGVGGVVLKG